MIWQRTAAHGSMAVSHSGLHWEKAESQAQGGGELAFGPRPNSAQPASWMELGDARTKQGPISMPWPNAKPATDWLGWGWLALSRSWLSGGLNAAYLDWSSRTRP